MPLPSSKPLYHSVIITDLQSPSTVQARKRSFVFLFFFQQAPPMCIQIQSTSPRSNTPVEEGSAVHFGFQSRHSPVVNAHGNTVRRWAFDDSIFDSLQTYRMTWFKHSCQQIFPLRDFVPWHNSDYLNFTAVCKHPDVGLHSHPWARLSVLSLTSDTSFCLIRTLVPMRNTVPDKVNVYTWKEKKHTHQ